MKKGIASRQKKPFDYEAAENYTLSPDADDTVNNSYYFSAHDAEKKESLYLRLGLRNCHSEAWFCYEKGDKRYKLADMIYPSSCPLAVYKDGEIWRMTFDGFLSGEDGEKIQSSFEGTFSSNESAVDFFTHMPPIRTAKAMAAEKWNKKFFAEVQRNNQVHYEQLGFLSGVLRIGGQSVEIAMPCVRDHSFGKRDWNYMNNHLWLMAVNDTEQLNFSMVSYPAMTALEVGNFKPENKSMAFVLQADYDRAAIANGEAPQDFEIKLRLDSGETLDVKAHKQSEIAYLFQDGQYKLVEGVADFTINGKAFRGIIEVGANGDKSRIFNGKNIGKIKA